MHKHIINGLSSASHLRMHLQESLDNVAILEDHLIVGPLLPVDDMNHFNEQRLLFWEKNTYDRSSWRRHSMNKFINDINTADSYTLWLAPGAHDQIMWTFLVHLFKHLEIDWKKVKVKHFFNTPSNTYPYIGLGEFAPEQFADCEEFSIDHRHIATLHETYEALIDPQPNKLLDICTREDCLLPELHASLKAFIKLYPDSKTGLTVYEKALLQECSTRRLKSARIVGGAMGLGDYDNRLMIGDDFLFHRLVQLSQLHANNPLVNFFGKLDGNPSMRFTEVSITELGQQVLNGSVDNINLNGINQYIGGVHLSSKNTTDCWRYDSGQLVYG